MGRTFARFLFLDMLGRIGNRANSRTEERREQADRAMNRKAMKKRAKQGEPQTITKAVTHIRLEATNAGKLTALDAVASVYLELTQQYTTLFCTTEAPNGFRAPCFLTLLS